MSCDGTLTGRSAGRCRSASLNDCRGPSVGKGAGQRRQQIALLGERLAQRRQRRPDLRQRGFLRRHFAAIGVARFELLAEDVEHLGVDAR